MRLSETYWLKVSNVPDFELRTDRLILRDWREADRALFATMNADRSVMEFFTSVLSPDQSNLMVERFSAELAERGYCPWAVELTHDGAFIGFVGLHTIPDDLLFAPGVEVGWRLAKPFWGCGYATEAGAASLRYGFNTLGFEEIVSFTAAINLRSRRVMERLGMSRDENDDFEHPWVAEYHPLRPHVLYRKANPINQVPVEGLYSVPR